MPRVEHRFFGIKLNSDKDADLICFLESKENKQEVIKKALNIAMLQETGDILIIANKRRDG